VQLRDRIIETALSQCMTTKGDELTRATAIDFYTGKVVFDELIKPEGTVTDYKTQYVMTVGITNGIRTDRDDLQVVRNNGRDA
jgi:hypothetical protein